MELNLKRNLMGGYIIYPFNLKIEGKTYEHISVKCSNFGNKTKTHWNTKPGMLTRAKNFKEIENKLFSYFENEFNKNFNNKTI